MVDQIYKGWLQVARTILGLEHILITTPNFTGGWEMQDNDGLFWWMAGLFLL